MSAKNFSLSARGRSRRRRTTTTTRIATTIAKRFFAKELPSARLSLNNFLGNIS